MDDRKNKLDEVFDENVLVNTRFVRTNGKLRIVKVKTVEPDGSGSDQKPLFPISKVRK